MKIHPLTYSILGKHNFSITTPEFYLMRVCNYYDLTLQQLKSSNREIPLPDARHLFFFLVLSVCKISTAKAAAMVNRNHATAIHGRNKIMDLIETNDPYTLKALNHILRDQISNIILEINRSIVIFPPQNELRRRQILKLIYEKLKSNDYEIRSKAII
jgi:chromosomal replication initiation ATPase DnaA